MPSRVTEAGDRKVLIAVAGVSLALMVLSLILSARGDQADTPTTYSTGSGGAKAAYLLLEAAGYSQQRWERSAVELPRDGGATLIVAEPDVAPTADERAAVSRFMDAGGRVVATGAAGAMFLPEHRTALDPIEGLTWRRLAARSPSSITRAAPEITLAPGAFWDAEQPVLPLYGDGVRTRVIMYNVGRGDAVWWASATPLTNAGIREPGNLEFLLACLGDRRRPVYWNEYAHGYQAVSSAAIDTDISWLGAQLALVLAAVIATYSRRSGPVLAAPAENRLSPLEFVRTLGALYERAGAAPVAVDIAYERFRYQLTRRLGLRSDAPANDLARAVSDRRGIHDPELAALLRSCETARHDATLTPAAALALVQSLADWSARLGLVETRSKEHA
jgi:hypothetical protein